MPLENPNLLKMHPLSYAWLDLIDTLKEGGKKQWATFRQRRSSDDLKMSERARVQLAAFKYELKCELIDRIQAGELWAYGRDITHDLDPPLTKLSPALFNPQASNFEVDWESSALSAFGKQIIDVAVGFPDPTAGQRVLPKKRGRPNHTGEAIRAACNIAVKGHPQFFTMRLKEAVKLAEEALKFVDDVPPGLLVRGINIRTFGRIHRELLKAKQTQNVKIDLVFLSP